MGVYRRKFTREVKLAAIQQLETGLSAAEVAWAFEVNPALCTAGARSSTTAQATHILEKASGAGRNARGSRPHSSFGYRTPNEFAEQLRTQL